MNQKIEEIQNNFESKISCKIETNSRGFNTVVHVYQGISKKEIDETVKMTIYAHNQLQLALVSKVTDVKVIPELA